MLRPDVLPFYLTFLKVYPETRGVPLEEMDAVFGEGAQTTDFS